MLSRVLALSTLALFATGCANNNNAEEPFTPAADASYNSGGGYTGSSVYGGGANYQPSVPATAQKEPGGLERYHPREFNDYTEEQAQTYTTVSSDGTVTTTNRTTGQTTTSGGNYGNYVGSGGTYVVAKGDTFYQLARRFYNNEARWRDIWNANRARVPNKDRLPVGIKLIIP